MNLENKLLHELAEAQPVGERHELTTTEGAWSAHLTYDRREELSGRLWEVALHRNSVLDGDVATWGNRIVQRVTGLMEPLRVVEVDAKKQEALLRSAAPTAKGAQLFYYEIHLRGLANAVVRRFQATHQTGQKRAQVAFALTHESLAKLAADITAEK